MNEAGSQLEPVKPQTPPATAQGFEQMKAEKLLNKDNSSNEPIFDLKIKAEIPAVVPEVKKEEPEKSAEEDDNTFRSYVGLEFDKDKVLKSWKEKGADEIESEHQQKMAWFDVYQKLSPEKKALVDGLRKNWASLEDKEDYSDPEQIALQTGEALHQIAEESKNLLRNKIENKEKNAAVQEPPVEEEIKIPAKETKEEVKPPESKPEPEITKTGYKSFPGLDATLRPPKIEDKKEPANPDAKLGLNELVEKIEVSKTQGNKLFGPGYWAQFLPQKIKEHNIQAMKSGLSEVQKEMAERGQKIIDLESGIKNKRTEIFNKQSELKEKLAQAKEFDERAKLESQIESLSGELKKAEAEFSSKHELLEKAANEPKLKKMADRIADQVFRAENNLGPGFKERVRRGYEKAVNSKIFLFNRERLRTLLEGYLIPGFGEALQGRKLEDATNFIQGKTIFDISKGQLVIKTETDASDTETIENNDKTIKAYVENAIDQLLSDKRILKYRTAHLGKQTITLEMVERLKIEMYKELNKLRDGQKPVISLRFAKALRNVLDKDAGWRQVYGFFGVGPVVMKFKKP